MATLAEKRKFIRNWPLFTPPIRNFFLHKEVIAYLNNGIALSLRGTRSSDFYAMGTVIFDDVYKIDLIKDPKRILDIGANIGTFTVVAAKRFPNAKIIAVEPEPHNVSQLKKNIELNHLSNVEIHQCAVSSTYGVAKLYIDQERPSAHSLYSAHVVRKDAEHSASAAFIDVKTVPLSSFGHVDAMKIDCEGSEVAILDNNIPDCQYVAIEFDTNDKDRILDQFIENGYSVDNRESTICVMTR